MRERKYRRFGEFLRDSPDVPMEHRKLVGYDPSKNGEREKLEKDKALAENGPGTKDKPALAKAALAKAEKALEDFKSEMEDKLCADMDANRPAVMELFQLAKAKVVRKCMQKLVDEVRGSQIYVDGDGIPTIRRKAKSSLRKIDT